MPRAVVDVTPQRYELKSCPPDGYVELKRMSYDKWLHRTDISLGMQIEMEDQKRRRTRASSGRMADLKLQNQAVTTYELRMCVVGHNLEDEQGNLLDFRNSKTLEILDPKVGNEIGELIALLHEPLTEDEEGNF